MSADEWADWKAVDSISPIGRIRADLQAAIVAQTTANCHLGRNQRAFSRTDFMPFYEPPKQTDDEIGTVLLQWGKHMKAALDAKKKKKRKRNG